MSSPHLDQGQQYLKEHRFFEAVTAFDLVLAQTPNHQPALLGRAQARLGLGLIDQAQQDINTYFAMAQPKTQGPGAEATVWFETASAMCVRAEIKNEKGDRVGSQQDYHAAAQLLATEPTDAPAPLIEQYGALRKEVTGKLGTIPAESAEMMGIAAPKPQQPIAKTMAITPDVAAALANTPRPAGQPAADPLAATAAPQSFGDSTHVPAPTPPMSPPAPTPVGVYPTPSPTPQPAPQPAPQQSFGQPPNYGPPVQQKKSSSSKVMLMVGGGCLALIGLCCLSGVGLGFGAQSSFESAGRDHAEQFLGQVQVADYYGAYNSTQYLGGSGIYSVDQFQACILATPFAYMTSYSCDNVDGSFVDDRAHVTCTVHSAAAPTQITLTVNSPVDTPYLGFIWFSADSPGGPVWASDQCTAWSGREFYQEPPAGRVRPQQPDTIFEHFQF